MGQYCFARWRLPSVGVVCRLSSFVTLPAGGPDAGRVGGRAPNTARRASMVTSGYGDTLFLSFLVPCARLSWPCRQLLSARKYTVSYRILSYDCRRLTPLCRYLKTWWLRSTTTRTERCRWTNGSEEDWRPFRCSSYSASTPYVLNCHRVFHQLMPPKDLAQAVV